MLKITVIALGFSLSAHALGAEGALRSDEPKAASNGQITSDRPGFAVTEDAPSSPEPAPVQRRSSTPTDKSTTNTFVSEPEPLRRGQVGSDVNEGTIAPTTPRWPEQQPMQTVQEQTTKTVNEIYEVGSSRLDEGVSELASGLIELSVVSANSSGSSSAQTEEMKNEALQKVANGVNSVDAAHAAVAQGNRIAENTNRQASLGAARPVSTRELSFSREGASAGTSAKLDEMEKVTGLSADDLISAVNGRNRREEIASLAGGIKNVGLSSSQIASSFGSGSYARPSQATYSPSATGSSQNGSEGQRFAASPATASKAWERKPASEGSRAARPREEDKLFSLGADNLLSSLGHKKFEQEGSIFERVSGQYTKRLSEFSRGRPKLR